MLLSLENITTCFTIAKNVRSYAVNGVSLSIGKGEIVGIVGESGSGKTVLTHSIMRLLPAQSAITGGRALFNGADLLTIPQKQLSAIRGNTVSMIFQDPSSSLNPYSSIRSQMIEPLILHKKMSVRDAQTKAVEMLKEVGIENADEKINSFPHQFSGGMRQRVMIAMALLTNPQLLIADEPTTALDVTVQAQILSLLSRLQKQFGMSVLFITHNLAVVSNFCDRAAVMYGGKIMELAPVTHLFSQTAHPYTRALIKSIPSIELTDQKLFSINGMPPDPLTPVTGCPFAQRCSFADMHCAKEPVELSPITANHYSSCTRIKKGEISFE